MATQAEINRHIQLTKDNSQLQREKSLPKNNDVFQAVVVDCGPYFKGTICTIKDLGTGQIRTGAILKSGSVKRNDVVQYTFDSKGDVIIFGGSGTSTTTTVSAASTNWRFITGDY